MAALQQVDAGAFGLETSAIDYLGLEGTAISPDVTVRHLLTHTSGIGDDADEEAGERYEELWRERPNYSVREAVDFLPGFVHRAPNFAPGQGCRYNNCGYVLLGLMVERATGRSYRDVVRDDVFAPAGMADSDFLGMDRVNERLAEGADPIRDETGAIRGWKRNIYAYPPIGSPDGGAHVTTADLDRFMRAVLDGRLMSPELDWRLPRAAGDPQRARRAGGALRLRPMVPRRRRRNNRVPREGGQQRRRQRPRSPLPGAGPDRGHALEPGGRRLGADPRGARDGDGGRLRLTLGPAGPQARGAIT